MFFSESQPLLIPQQNARYDDCLPASGKEGVVFVTVRRSQLAQVQIFPLDLLPTWTSVSKGETRANNSPGIFPSASPS